LIFKYQKDYGKPLKPVVYTNKSILVPQDISCPYCNAPHNYLYINNGNKKSQFLCKVCKSTFAKDFIHHNPKYYCPYCNHPLFKWKDEKDVTLYKCGNHNCSYYVDNYNKLNDQEIKLYLKNPGHFTLHYIYRDYHYKIEELNHSKPVKPVIDLNKIHNSQNVLGLILTFFVSFAISARKTALMLKWVFNINVSYQTVLNYAQASSYYCHEFNMKYKGEVDNIMAGDETYIKVKGETNYIFFFISADKRSISTYHYSDNRGTLPAIISMNEAKRTAINYPVTFITDGNPSYVAALHFINSLDDTNKIRHHKVIGLQNLDSESEQYRCFKQLIERLNRTYKSHIKQANGFSSPEGAIALTTLFVTFYNFLRPHMALKYKVPVPLDFLDDIPTIQGKWLKILSMAYG
jgi:putative transposase